ncbi:unnamed protein product [Moneuplotes crassus]|uniref:Uncharacterized protein n=1 Tax=Euplotes crassus TaxID=5936 RepID=A0AAD1U964_EUPCR|nr:unnamed protein product [Moneuplotes crassus]
MEKSQLRLLLSYGCMHTICTYLSIEAIAKVLRLICKPVSSRWSGQVWKTLLNALEQRSLKSIAIHGFGDNKKAWLMADHKYRFYSLSLYLYEQQDAENLLLFLEGLPREKIHIIAVHWKGSKKHQGAIVRYLSKVHEAICAGSKLKRLILTYPSSESLDIIPILPYPDLSQFSSELGPLSKKFIESCTSIEQLCYLLPSVMFVQESCKRRRLQILQEERSPDADYPKEFQSHCSPVLDQEAKLIERIEEDMMKCQVHTLAKFSLRKFHRVMKKINCGFGIISLESCPIMTSSDQAVLSYPSAVILSPFGVYTVENLSLIFVKESYIPLHFCEVIKTRYGEYPQEVCVEELLHISFNLKCKGEPHCCFLNNSHKGCFLVCAKEPIQIWSGGDSAFDFAQSLSPSNIGSFRYTLEDRQFDRYKINELKKKIERIYNTSIEIADHKEKIHFCEYLSLLSLPFRDISLYFSTDDLVSMSTEVNLLIDAVYSNKVLQTLTLKRKYEGFEVTYSLKKSQKERFEHVAHSFFKFTEVLDSRRRLIDIL